MAAQLTNWAGNYAYSTGQIHYPENIEQLQTLITQYEKIRVLGTRHSFNGIADSTKHLISLERFAPLVNIDAEQRSVTVGAHVTYGLLCPILHQAGFALHNMASLPHISVIGACSTATHGSGVKNRNLASIVSGVEWVTANGELVKVSREDGDAFHGAVVNLGALGVIVSMSLDIQPAFEISQYVYENLSLSEVETHFDEIMSSAYSVSLFTDWRGDSVKQVWMKQRSEDRPSIAPDGTFFGATPATRQMHPIGELAGDQCTEQLGRPGHWHERLPHFRIDATPSAGNELQTEYFVGRADAVEALLAVRNLRDMIAPHLLISEIRSIAADDLWMSPAYQQDVVGVHFTWKQDWPSVSKILPLIEAELAPFNAKPHWGKLFTMLPRHVQSRYEKLPAFKELMQHYDPQSKFRNAFVDTTLFGS